MTIAASTMAPIAIAMPPRLMILAPSPSRLHRAKSHQDANGEHQDRHQGAAEMQQKHDADQRDDEALLEQRVLERVDRRVNQVGAVIDRHDLDGFRQAAGDLRGAFLHVFDDVERVERRSVAARCRWRPRPRR